MDKDSPAPGIRLVSETADTVTLRRADFESLLDDLEDAEDNATLLKHRLAEATGTLPKPLTIEEADRLINGESPVKVCPDTSLEEGISDAGTLLTETCYKAAKNAGWHNHLGGDPRTRAENHELFPTRIALCHSELSEALEGHRKNLMDDHLPHRKMAEVELADAVIRICDLAGSVGYDLGSAIAEKLAYNAQRADHKLSARMADDGKRY